MKFRTKLLIYLVILAIIDTVIPIPITCLVIIYVLLERPPWFRNYVQQVYGE